ncbi:hypothetical protein SAMN05661093_07752 [Kibdelosporangium aridum]|uniref:Uncharacterized protein n=1 Tax=Kibdelosporangium aridum TaxID=2030 RepID=A0A1Y5Y095_KIBAR|nr:hypothetical protein SAMN05661093_07752 [Kibdelosporangium aridum]
MTLLDEASDLFACPRVATAFWARQLSGLREDHRWLWEAVILDGDVVAIKQIEVPSSGPSRRYWWQHLEETPAC